MLIDALDDLIGTTTSQNPVGYVCCVMFILWFIYLFYNLVYWVLGGKK